MALARLTLARLTLAHLSLACLVAAPPAWAALDVPLPPGARATADEVRLGALRLPIAPYSADAAPARRVEGRIRLRAWRVSAEQGDPFRNIRRIRAALVAAGYTPDFECESDACGGFDFRFGIDVLPPPQMQVDLTDFHYLSARRDAPESHVTVLTSRTAVFGFVQTIEIAPLAPPLPDATPPDAAPPDAAPPETAPPETAPPETAPPAGVTVAPPRPDTSQAAAPERPVTDRPVTDLPVTGPPPETRDLAAALAAEGRAVIEGLVFAPGASRLDPESSQVLAGLAAYLASVPERRFAIVGHSDNVGSLSANLALSEARATSVRRELIERFGVSPQRLRAAGVGYLSPRASNATAEGRELNRRVELVAQ